MSGARPVLFVDGPLAGQVHVVSEPPLFLVPDRVPVAAVLDPASDVQTGQRAYHFHKLYLFGRVLRLGSVHADDREIKPGDLWELLISDQAKRALIHYAG